MNTGSQGITAKAWLYMLAHGRCTAAQLAAVVGVGRKQMDNLLFSMVNRDYAERYPCDDRKNGTAYGVTPASKVPQNTHLADILFAARERPRPATLTIPHDRMKAAAMPDWQSGDDPRIPRVVEGWKPPTMTPPRAGA
jgi:hypothetical protein